MSGSGLRSWLYVVALVGLACPISSAQKLRPAIPLRLGQSVELMLDKDESKDVSAQLGPGAYYVVVDSRRGDGEISNIQVQVQLLKSNGSIIEPGLVRINEICVSSRDSVRYTFTRPMAVRFRVHSDQGPMLVWLTAVPVAKWAFVPFPAYNGEIKQLGIGPNNGKGGTLEKAAWAYHAIKLNEGKWNISLYAKRQDGSNSNIQMDLEALDEFGMRLSPPWKLTLNEIGSEARREKELSLSKGRSLIFKVMNQHVPMEYVVDIERAK